MRKILSLLLVLLTLVSLLPVVAFATTELPKVLPYEKEIPVLVRAVYTSDLPEFPIDDGEGGGKLPDGTDVWVEDAPAGAVILVVRKIDQSETGPYTWFKQVLNGKGELFQAYQIYFLDADRNRIEANGAVITLSIPDGMKKTVLYSVDTDSSYAKLTDILKGSKVRFTTDGSLYYVFAGYKPTGGTNGGSAGVKTGDASHIFLWMGICAVSLLILLLILWLLKKRKKEESK